MKKYITMIILVIGLSGLHSIYAQLKPGPSPTVEIQLTADQIKIIKSGTKSVPLTASQADLLLKKAKSFLGDVKLKYTIFEVQGPDVIATDGGVTLMLKGTTWIGPKCTVPNIK